MLNRFVGLNFCQTQNWSGRPWRSSCHTPLTMRENFSLDSRMEADLSKVFILVKIKRSPNNINNLTMTTD